MRALLLVLALGGTADANPCFPGKPPIDALAMHRALDEYTILYDEGHELPPSRTYGACRVTATPRGNRLTAASDALVAELGCGVRVVMPGVRDELGIEVGDLGKEVLARKGSRALFCAGNGPDHTRCRLESRGNESRSPTSYVVRGGLGVDTLQGDKAVALFASRRLVEIHAVATCH